MKHLMCMFILLAACGSGKDGSDGAAGTNGTDNKLSLIRVCNAILKVSFTDSPAYYWNEAVVSYERAETVAGDVQVSAAVVTGAGNASGVTFFKADSQGAAQGEITLRPDKSHSLKLSATAGIEFLSITPGEGAVVGDPNNCADI